MAKPKPSTLDVNTATYDQTRAWTEKQLKAGVSPQDLRAIADEQNRHRDGNTSVVDGIRHVTG
ncbi:hypothetical protein [Nonomuraea basaltis]|uniref:hypothetical protein n=1 Tax=Nonomuraea basaltis TaxID=2495887 RepID=UPI00110C509C|nr:hypothetical protein [Nonomuraea basaltis]TMS00211.1 hypothetical protein EJK15_03810 [Nonomuraea basaltis]